MNRHSALAPAAVVAAALAFAPAASATTRYVSPTGPNVANCAEGTPCDFAKVISLTGANDTIVVKQGTYLNNPGFTINVANVAIVGEAGPTKPKLSLSGAFPIGVGVAFGPAAGGGDLRDIDFDAPLGAIPVIATAPVTVSNVDVNSSAGCMSFASGSTIADSDLTQTPGAFVGSCLSGGEGTTIRNVTVTSAQGATPGLQAVQLTGGGHSIDRLATTGPGGVVVGSPVAPSSATTTIRRSRIATSASGAFPPAPALSLLSPATVTDSLVRTNSSSALPGAAAMSSAANAKLRNVTALASGTGATALLTQAGSAATTLSIKNSILRGDTAAVDITVMPGGPPFITPPNPICATVPTFCLPTVGANVTVDHSNFRGATGTLTPASGSNQTADPQFGNAAGGDFRPQAGSPAIDAGVDDPDNGPADLDGNARNQGAAPDIGAFEFPVAPPPADQPPAGQTPQPTAPSGGGEPAVTPPVVDRISPALSALGITNKTFAVAAQATPVAARAKKGTTFVYTLSEAATSTLTIERAETGRRKGKSCVKATSKNRKAKKCTRYVKVGTLARKGLPGANAVTFSGRIGTKVLKPAAYRASLVAVDPAGNRSKARTIGFEIVKK